MQPVVAATLLCVAGSSCVLLGALASTPNAVPGTARAAGHAPPEARSALADAPFADLPAGPALLTLGPAGDYVVREVPRASPGAEAVAPWSAPHEGSLAPASVADAGRGAAHLRAFFAGGRDRAASLARWSEAALLVEAHDDTPWRCVLWALQVASGGEAQVAHIALRAPGRGGWTPLVLPSDSCATKAMRFEPGFEVQARLGRPTPEGADRERLRLRLERRPAGVGPAGTGLLVRQEQDGLGADEAPPIEPLEVDLATEPGWAAVEDWLSRALPAHRPWGATLRGTEAGVAGLPYGAPARLLALLHRRGATVLALAGTALPREAR